MTDAAIQIIAGIILLLFSTRTFLKQSENLSRALMLSPLIIGMTIVAIGTSLPELSVSSIASAKGDVSLAIGNIVGSNITNILLVFSAAVLIGNLRIGTTKTLRNALILLFITIVYSLSNLYDIFPNYLSGLFFIISALVLTFMEYKWALIGRKNEDAKRFKNIKPERFSAGKMILLFISILGVIAGGYLMVVSTENISLLTGLSTGVLGLTLTALATSLPEVLTTVFSQENHDEKISMGNIMGSNIYNILLIGGLIDLLSADAQTADISWGILNAVTVLFVTVLFLFKGKVVPKYVGLISLLIFLGYMLYETNNLF